jgi:hypothetical protein
MIFSAGDFGVEIDMGVNEPGADESSTKLWLNDVGYTSNRQAA